MSKIFTGILLCLLCLSLSCDLLGGYSFIDQPLQGQIGGDPWTFVSGTAEDFGGEYWYDLYDIAPAGGDPWALGAYSAAQDKVLFTLPETTGLWKLSFSQSVTLYDFSSSMNTICISGAVEIISIDNIGNTITGRIDARSDSGNTINGNFTVALHP